MAAYIIGVIDIHHLDNYKEYGARVPEVVEKFGGRYLVRGGEHEMLEEGAPGSRFYDSPEYQEIVGIRTGASSGFLAAVDGT